MRIFKAMIERVEIEKKWLPQIHAELKKYNESAAALSHAIAGISNDIRRQLELLVKNEAEFLSTLTSFFALSKDLQLQEAKRKAQAAEDAAPGKHDDSF